VGALRPRIHAALEGAQPPPTGSGERDADRPETHDINADATAPAGSNTATANGDVRVAEPVPKAETTWRKSAPRRAPRIPCECCVSLQAFKRAHGLTTWEAYKRQHWPMIAVKDAWRNPTVHVEQDYNEETALDAWNAARAFMRQLAQKLKER
jgi:hypothetical protein